MKKIIRRFVKRVLKKPLSIDAFEIRQESLTKEESMELLMNVINPEKPTLSTKVSEALDRMASISGNPNIRVRTS